MKKRFVSFTTQSLSFQIHILDAFLLWLSLLTSPSGPTTAAYHRYRHNRIIPLIVAHHRSQPTPTPFLLSFSSPHAATVAILAHSVRRVSSPRPHRRRLHLSSSERQPLPRQAARARGSRRRERFQAFSLGGRQCGRRRPTRVVRAPRWLTQQPPWPIANGAGASGDP